MNTVGNIYCVYRHTFPDGSEYIGISSAPESRWANGHGYRDNPNMLNALIKYGWDNVKHEILYDGLSEEEAERIEKEMIYERSKSVMLRNRKGLYKGTKEPQVIKWYDMPITEELARRYRHSFSRDLNDDWLEPYADMNGMVDSVEIYSYKVSIIDYAHVGGNTFLRVTRSARYPAQCKTFREVHSWLCTTPEFEVECVEEVKINIPFDTDEE